jgi:hypothetical protein
MKAVSDWTTKETFEKICSWRHLQAVMAERSCVIKFKSKCLKQKRSCKDALNRMKQSANDCFFLFASVCQEKRVVNVLFFLL